MKIDRVINLLRRAETGSRSLDSEIAQIIGWKKVEQAAGSGRSRTLWLVPKTGDPGKVPNYTTSIEAAYQLAQQISPGDVGACTWRGDVANAQLGESGQLYWAHTTALALCIAILHILKQREPK